MGIAANGQWRVTAPMVVDDATLPAPCDSALIRTSLAAGEEFAVVFDRHATAVHRYLSRRVGRGIADDLTAETFLVAFRQRERYDLSQPDARPWLYGIATNVLHHQRRAEVRQFRALARTGVDPVGENHADQVVTRVTATAATRRLASVLAKLPVGERDVLLLIAWEEFSYVEVARALGIPVGTVRSRLHSARRRLRAVLSDLDPTSRK
jgi:RNA polymerase sigma-70 factor (ECF subfamily)